MSKPEAFQFFSGEENLGPCIKRVMKEAEVSRSKARLICENAVV